MRRHETEPPFTRGRERPRDEYGRFETEYDQRGRYEGRPGEHDYGREDRYGHDEREYRRHRSYEVQPETRWEREGPFERHTDWDERSSSAGPKIGAQHRWERPAYDNERYFQGGSQTGNNYRFESVYGVQGYGNAGSRQDRGYEGGRPFESSRGQFAGSGPKNYRRSDERIQE